MLLLFVCLLTLQCPAYAKSSRTVRLSDGDMEQIFVEPGFSTLLKFGSHPEPGLIGDQDGFKVEYMKNLVAIKPLISKGKTNLFIFTKEGQFNFQLVASHGQHDNVVYVEPRLDRFGSQPTTAKVAIPIDNLLTRRINKLASAGSFRLYLESISTPVSRSTLVLKFTVQEQLKASSAPSKIEVGAFTVTQGAQLPIKIENAYLDSKALGPGLSQITGLILIRAAELKKSQPLRLTFTPPAGISKGLQVAFTVDFIRR